MLARLLFTVVALALGCAAATVEEAAAYRGGTNPATLGPAWVDGSYNLDMDAPLPKAMRGGPADPAFPSTTPAGWDASDTGRITKARRAFGALPKLRTLGTISLYATAFQVGWTIGRTIDTKWLHLDGDIGIEDASWTVESWTFVAAGANRDESGWVLSAAAPGSGLSAKIVVQTGNGGIACDSTMCPGGSVGVNNAYRTEFLRQASLSPGVWQDYRASTNQPTYNCQAGGTFGGCYELFVPEATMESTIASGTVEPYVSQTTSNGNLSGNVTLPTTITQGQLDEVIAALTEDEAEAQAAAGTEAEESTTAWQAGKAADPEWEGYEGEGITMPDCAGETVASCEALLFAAGHVGSVSELELDIATADLTQPAGAVVTTSPGATITLSSTDAVELNVNPDPMPILIPSPLPGETYAAWLVRLQALGYVGTVTVTELSEAAGNPLLGPAAPVSLRLPAVGTIPATTIVLPGGWPDTNPTKPRIMVGTPIEVWKNPTTYPPVEPTNVPPATGGGIPTTPTLDLTPITGLDFGCKFPFGFVCYAQDVTAWFNVTPDAPRFAFDLPDVSVLGTDYVTTGQYVVDLEVMDSYMALLRGLMSVAMWIGAVYWLAVRLLGFNAGGDPGEAVDEGLDWR